MRDLYRSREQAERSYSERTLYETAIETLVREVAAAHSHARTEAQKLIEQSRANVPRLKEARPAAEMDREEDEGEAAEGDQTVRTQVSLGRSIANYQAAREAPVPTLPARADRPMVSPGA
jgi:hypothetical protein